MQMINRAIDDAMTFMEFQRKLEARKAEKIVKIMTEKVESFGQRESLTELARKHPRRAGENREQHRARLRELVPAIAGKQITGVIVDELAAIDRQA